MAGHSKWANIKHRKSRQDAKRGKTFTKLLREIAAATKTGGGGDDNPRLRQAKDKAMALNMPRTTIERAIKRAAGGEDNTNYQSIIYEGYGPGGSAIYIEALTDNKNRCVAEIRHSLSRYGGSLGTGGSVSYLFQKLALLEITNVENEDKLLQDALDSGAQDVQRGEGKSFYVQGEPNMLIQMAEILKEKDYQLGYQDVVMQAHQPVTLKGADAEKLKELLSMLEDLDDIANVYSNVELMNE